jgi:hypothetical protein
LYEGKPSAGSDQYSLAIVYQVMLTGVPPFLGRTAAQLAAQHLSSQPNLQPLPMTDRPAIARALSKHPDARFPSCGDFLEELIRRRSGENERKPRVVSLPAEKKQSSPTCSKKSVFTGSTEFVNSYIESRPHQTAGVEASQAVYRPTLVIGLGGLAGRVLGEFKHRVRGRFGEDTQLPGLGLLYLDTDGQAVSQASRADHGSLSYQETLAIPLRSPQDYKSNDVDFSDWLSRRWLFNIPRSRQVQGMRALGRLAFADHHHAIRQRVQEHIARLNSKEALAAMREQTGLPFEPGPPNVVVLASIMGGTGGGGVLDLGYLLRDELSAMALDGGEFEGLLLFGTDYHDVDRDLAIANGLCVLRELDHFTRFSFPGDPTCHLPEIPAPPFQNNYLIHLGEKLDEKSVHEGLASVAEYLYRETFTSARAFFQQFRNGSAAEAEPDEVMHTFGVCRIDPEPSPEQQGQCLELVKHLLAGWIKPLSETEREQVKRMGNPWCEAKLDALGWKQSHILDRGIQMMGGGNGPNFDAFLEPLLADCPATTPAMNAPKAQKLLEERIQGADQAFEDCSQSGQSGHPQRLLSAFQAQLQEQAEESLKWFQDAIWGAIDYWPQPLETANAVLDHTLKHLEACRNQLALVLQQITGELETFAAESAGGLANSPLSSEDLKAYLSRYADLKYCQETHRALLNFVGTIRASLGGMPAVFQQLKQTLEQFLKANAGLPSTGQAAQEMASWGNRFDQELRRKGQRQFKQLAEATELADLEWLQHISEEAKEFVVFAIPTASETEDGEHNPLLFYYAGAKPQLDGVGGVRSAVLMIPNTESAECETHSQAALGDCVSVMVEPQEPLFLCCETRNLKLSAVQNSICDRREDLKEVSTRLHTRIDVKW